MSKEVASEIASAAYTGSSAPPLPSSTRAASPSVSTSDAGNPETPNGNGAILTDTQRSGSITGVGIVLGFSLTFLWQFSTAPDPWTLRGVFPLIAILIGIALQMRALFGVLGLPPLSVRRHKTVLAIFLAGVGFVLTGLAAKLTIDVWHDLRTNHGSAETIGSRALQPSPILKE